MSAPIIFGKVHICPHCGKIANERHKIGFAMGRTQGDAWLIEYCEHCAPATAFELMIDTIAIETASANAPTAEDSAE